ncbi:MULTISPECIES: protease modulator HflC [Sphingomonas]|uniref:Protein HflC n=1 Tax=Sphingomonas molluscorum TaxID=418184 RepID=A0ABU8Q4A8_9SPHN|nr:MULTISPECIES: protease modulator HflC [unclassified Sphingomonas]MBM7405273.1 membrane protease subunit HflC [Sphingomonas sp. JUb134]RSV13625.1 protease modulator HflC [Sphingomonas sp. ABOLF]GLK20988.1 protein HflC [Microbacterium terregens]
MSRSLFRNPVAIGIALLVLAILAVSSIAIVPEAKQAVILRVQQPIAIVNRYEPGQPFGRSGAGIVLRIPFLDRLVWVEKRVLAVELDNQQVLSSDQQRLEVDAFARFRIVNPVQMVVTAGSEQSVADQLQPILGSTLRGELGKRPFAALLSPERTQVMENIQTALQRTAAQYGAEIVDVRIKHADLPEGSPLTSALNRMRSARQQEAVTIQARGQKQAQIIRADAEAQAAQIYAQSFGKDADFYAFWRAMESYRTTFAKGEDNGDTSIVLSPNNGYLREFQGRER